MKDLHELFEAELDLDEDSAGATKYAVGDSIAFNIEKVSKRNKDAVVSDDSGTVMSVSGKIYKVKLHVNDLLVNVAEDEITSRGDSADSGAQDTTGPVDDGQIP